jgi:hypothetical protein
MRSTNATASHLLQSIQTEVRNAWYIVVYAVITTIVGVAPSVGAWWW